jgi:flagellar FliJ protein
VKQFQFKLDPVLKYRRHLEERARMDLAKAMMACRDIRSRIQEVCLEKERMVAHLQQESRDGIAACRYLECRNFVHRLERDLETARTQLKKQEKKVHTLRSRLKQQYIEKESLVSLKSSHAGEHKKQVEIELQKSSDELVLLRRGGGI